jgi:hypothetical protein
MKSKDVQLPAIALEGFLYIGGVGQAACPWTAALGSASLTADWKLKNCPFKRAVAHAHDLRFRQDR